jgi:hypothetical protein
MCFSFVPLGGTIVQLRLFSENKALGRCVVCSELTNEKPSDSFPCHIVCGNWFAKRQNKKGHKAP